MSQSTATLNIYERARMHDMRSAVLREIFLFGFAWERGRSSSFSQSVSDAISATPSTMVDQNKNTLKNVIAFIRSDQSTSIWTLNKYASGVRSMLIRSARRRIAPPAISPDAFVLPRPKNILLLVPANLPVSEISRDHKLTRRLRLREMYTCCTC